VAVETSGRRVGQLRGASRRQVPLARQEICTEGRWRGAHIRIEGWVRRRREARFKRETLLTSRQYWRYAFAHHPSGFNDAPAAVRRTEGSSGRRTGRGAFVGGDRGQGRYYRRPRARPLREVAG